MTHLISFAKATPSEGGQANCLLKNIYVVLLYEILESVLQMKYSWFHVLQYCANSKKIRFRVCSRNTCVQMKPEF